MGFKIADAYVAVDPKDDNFEVGLKRIVEDAAAKVEAKVGLGVKDDGPASLREDIDVAIDLVTARLDANVGLGLRNDAVEELDADVKAGVELVGENNKVKVKVDPQAAKAAGNAAGAAAAGGMSPLIIAALAGAGTIGGSLLLAGLGVGMVGATALVLRNNAAISADFKKVGGDAANAIETAAAPLTAQLHQSLLDVDQTVRQLRPDFKELFAGAEPDISAVITGVTGLAGNLIPELSKAVSSSQVIVTDFSKSLPVLGSDIGRFFTGLVQNADLQGRALEGTVNTLGNTIDTLGSVIGSASAATSTPLIGLTHVVNGLDDAVRAVANPATVGGVIGLFGAMKLDPAVSKGLQSASNSLVTVAAKADGASGLLGKAGKAAELGATGFGKMADVMGGPWGLAIGAGIGLVSGLVAMLSHADDATKAITVSQGDLAAAIAQDNAKVGQSTSAFIAQQAQVSGLADEAKGAGVSLSLLTEAATGNKAAMSQLTSITGAANDVQRQQQLTAEESLTGQTGLTQAHEQGVVAVNSLYSSTVQLATGQDRMNSTFATGSQRLLEGAVASNTLTDANQQLLNSVHAQVQQVADAINKQTQLDAATAALNNTTDIFNATLAAEYEKLSAKAQVTGDNAVAALNLGTGQTALNQALAASVAQYNLASDGANGYQSVLTALNGTTNTLLASEASFTIALAGVTKAAQSNGHSLDVNNTKGAQNIQTFTGLAASAQKAATAVYESEVSTKGATVAYDDANTKLAQEKQAFIEAADNAGFNKRQIQALADELFKLPKDVTTNIHANTGPAISAVNDTIARINDSYGTIQVYANVHNPAGGKALGFNAAGGDVGAGDMSVVGEKGPEIVVFGRAGHVIPNDQIRTVGGTSTTSKAPGLGMTIHHLEIPITMTGIVDFTNPSAMDAAARRMAVNINNALVQVRNARTGAQY